MRIKHCMYLQISSAAFIVLLSILSGCSFYPEVRGSGELVTGTVDVTGFSRISISQTGSLHLSQAEEYSVTITVDDNVLEFVKAVKTDGKLEMSLNPQYSYTNITFSVEVSAPDILEIDVSGASEAVVEEFTGGKDLVVDISGASSVTLKQASADNVYLYIAGASSIIGAVFTSATKLDISGASSAELCGASDALFIDGSGASKCYLQDFVVEEADLELSGASYGEVHVNGRIDLDLSGASELYYQGSPTLGSIDLSGGSKLESLETEKT